MKSQKTNNLEGKDLLLYSHPKGDISIRDFLLYMHNNKDAETGKIRQAFPQEIIDTCELLGFINQSNGIYLTQFGNEHAKLYLPLSKKERKRGKQIAKLIKTGKHPTEKNEAIKNIVSDTEKLLLYIFAKGCVPQAELEKVFPKDLIDKCGLVGYIKSGISLTKSGKERINSIFPPTEKEKKLAQILYSDI